MATEAFLERVPGQDMSVMRCSLCQEQFHTSSVGPKKSIRHFPAHVREDHPNAVLKREDANSIVARIVGDGTRD